jgi:trans-aconitate 2-methyltransferase
MRWDPQQYGRFASERNRPFFDLTGRIGADRPARVADLGCGPGDLTASLALRWPDAQVVGLDSSPEMIERALAHRGPSIDFTLADATDFDATGVDVLVSNALLQWIPGQLDLLGRWARQLSPGGWIAFQVPANFASPSHRLMRETASEQPWRDRLHGVLRHDDAVAEPVAYLELLAGLGYTVDAWQTSYLHVLDGPDPVLQWVRGTGLRPVLDALTPAEAIEFEATYAAALRQAYPRRPYGTPFPFLRTFVVAHRPAP